MQMRNILNTLPTNASQYKSAGTDDATRRAIFLALRGGPRGTLPRLRQAVMRSLWKRGTRTVTEIAEDIGGDPVSVRVACRALVDLGLAGTLPGRPVRFYLLSETVAALEAEPWLSK